MIACRIYQRIMSSCAEAEAGLPGWLQKHLHKCAACAGYYEATTRLVQQLSAASNQPRSPSPFLHGKIMAAIRSRGEMRTQPENGVLAWAIISGATCLVAAVIIWWQQSPPPAPVASASGPSVPALSVNLPSVAQVDQWMKNMDAPLEREAQLVLSDANAALASLARNLLPDDLLGSSAGNTQH
jgi:hypothetical protein